MTPRPGRIVRAEPSAADLARFAVVSFDVFDTLVVRPLREPADLFLAVEAALRGEFSAAAVYWADRRRAAEAAARERAWKEEGRGEIRFAELRAPLALEFGAHVADRGLALETELELALCRPHPTVAPLFRALRAAGKRLVLASDMYLPADTVEAMLRRCGIEGHERLYLSSELDRTKGRGDLFAHLLGDLGVAATAVGHVGDNPHGDGRMASAAGIDAFLLPKLIERFDRSPLGDADRKSVWAPDRAAHLWESVVAGLYAARAGAGDGFEGPDDGAFWRRLGYFVGGPAMVGFARHVVAECARRGIDTVCFLARDGLIVRDTVERLGIAPPGLRLHYVHASRRCFNFAAIDRLDERHLDFLVGGTTRLTAAEFLARIGLDPTAPDVAAAIRRRFPAPGRRVASGAQYAALRELMRDLEPAIVARAAAERAALVRYLEGLALPDRDVAVVDVGWHGTLQRAMGETLVRHCGFRGALRGFYFGTFERAAPAEGHALHGYLFEAGRPEPMHRAARRCVEFLELIFAPPQPGVLRLVERDGAIEPEFAPTAGEEGRFAICRAVHEGILAFAEDFRDGGLLRCEAPLTGHLFRVLHRVLHAPTAEEARRIGDAPHAEGFGAGHFRRLAGAPPGWWRPFALREARRATFWSRGFRKRLGPAQRLSLKLARRLPGGRDG